MTQLAGKHALITGGLGCIGQAMVQVFAGAGARVTVLDRPALDATALPNGTGWLGVDLNDLAGAQMRAGAAGRFDILVNNAALSSIGHFRTSALKTTKSNCASKIGVDGGW